MRGLKEDMKKSAVDLYKAKKRTGLALIILLVTFILFSGYYLFIYVKPCDDLNCFSDALSSCKKVSWIKEDAQATWLYTILGKESKDSCSVRVSLLKMKQGTIDSEGLQGEKMVCEVRRAETQFPEKKISSCTGKLKEGLQDLIIQRMHNYLLKNVGEIKGEFSSL